MNDEKNPFQSKTLWASLLITLAGFFPPAQLIISAHPELATAAISGIFAIGRLFSSKKVSVTKK